jgi:hypothetical protein
MERKSSLAISVATAVLAGLGGAAVCAQDKYSLKSPSGIAFSDLRGYEDSVVVSSARDQYGAKAESDARNAIACRVKDS